ncbi:hypothetical protein FB451DRAFT_1551635 [Mycena latifolia]|nr:hypothetical protein FB451DRAFT_1551635 [Mycena latifolia]
MSPEGVMCTTLPVGAGPGEPVSECLFYPGCKEALLDLPGFPQPLMHPATPTFRIAATPGQGTGLFSTRALKMGDLILSERPLFVVPRVPYTPDVEKYFQLSVSRMRPAAKSAFMTLASSPKEDGSGPIIGIVRTHGLSLDGLPRGLNLDELLWNGKLKNHTYRAICEVISRLSHSNSPNTAPRFDLCSFSYQLFVLRNIAAGEELTSTDTYLDCPTPEPRKGSTFEDGVLFLGPGPAEPTIHKPCEKSLLELSLRVWVRDETLPDDWLIAKCREQLALARGIVGENLKNEDFRLLFEAVHTSMKSYICLGDAQGASNWAAKLNKILKGSDLDIKALVDPANAAYPVHSLWRRRVDRELAKNIPQPVLVKSQILFPMEWWH